MWALNSPEPTTLAAALLMASDVDMRATRGGASFPVAMSTAKTASSAVENPAAS